MSSLPITFWVLMTVMLINVNSHAQKPGIIESNNEPSDTSTFTHIWSSPEKSYELSENSISSVVIPTEEIMRLARHYRIEVIHDNQFRPASFQEDDPNAETPDSKPENQEENDQAKPLPYAGSSRFGLMKNSELRETIEKLRQEINGDGQVNEAVKSSRLQILTTAGDNLLKTEEYSVQTQQYENQIAQSDEEEKRLREALTKVQEPSSPVVSDDVGSDSLISELKLIRDELAPRLARLNELENQIKFHSDRVTQLPIDRARARETLSETRAEISKLGAGSEDIDNQLSLILQETRLRATEAELKKLDIERKHQEQASKVDPIERDLVSREIKRLKEEIARWETEIKALRANEVREERVAAKNAAKTAATKLKPLAERNVELVLQRQEVDGKLQKLKTELTRIDQQTNSIVERRTEIENKIDAAGLTGTNGMLLVDLRRNLQTTGESHIRIRQLQEELQNLNLAKVGLNQERDKLADPASTVADLLKNSDKKSELVESAIGFIETQRKYLDQLIEDYQSFGRTVSEVSESRKRLIDEINQTLNYIDKNALWISSADPLQLSDFNQAGQGLRNFFSGGDWNSILIETQQQAIQHPYEVVLAMAVMIALTLVNRQFKLKVRYVGEANEPSA